MQMNCQNRETTDQTVEAFERTSHKLHAMQLSAYHGIYIEDNTNRAMDSLEEYIFLYDAQDP